MPKIFPSILPDHDKDPDDNSGTLMTPKAYEADQDEADQDSEDEDND